MRLVSAFYVHMERGNAVLILYNCYLLDKYCVEGKTLVFQSHRTIAESLYSTSLYTLYSIVVLLFVCRLNCFQQRRSRSSLGMHTYILYMLYNITYIECVCSLNIGIPVYTTFMYGMHVCVCVCL